MPMGNDPTPLTELEAGFGVTSNAEELVAANFERMDATQRAGGLKPINEPLTEELDLAAVQSHVGDGVELVGRTVVRGSGAKAIISYTYVGPRGGVEKGYVPYVELFGSATEKRAAKATVDPDEAAGRAAREKRDKAEAEAQAKVDKARREAADVAAKAREEADKVLAEATAEAQRIREKAEQDAAKAGDKAREDADKAKAAAAKAK